jgi:hypothetical protein
MWHVWEKGEMHSGFWWDSLTGSDHLEALGIDGIIIFKLILTGSG